MVGQLALVDAVGRSADQHEAAVAIAAIDIAFPVDLQEHARVTECGPAGDVGRAVAGDAGMGDADEFGRRQHASRDSKRGSPHQSPPAARPDALPRRLAKNGAPPHHERHE